MMDFLKEWEQKLAIKITCSQACSAPFLWHTLLMSTDAATAACDSHACEQLV